jgi:LysM repeat protein
MSVHHDSPHTGDFDDDDRLTAWFVVPVALVTLFVLVIVFTWIAIGGSGAGSSTPAIDPDLPPYWTVRPGQTYAQIAEKTGLSIDQLETFNPYTDPSALIPGQRLKLRLRPPPPPRKPLGPRFWTVRKGQTFSSISVKTGHSIDSLRRLNRRLSPTALQPGDRVRLRP